MAEILDQQECAFRVEITMCDSRLLSDSPPGFGEVVVHGVDALQSRVQNPFCLSGNRRASPDGVRALPRTMLGIEYIVVRMNVTYHLCRIVVRGTIHPDSLDIVTQRVQLVRR